MPTMDRVLVWIIVGIIGGALAGALLNWDRRGFGLFGNLGLGLCGALVGGVLFWAFGLFPNLDRIAISLRDIVSAVTGSLIVMAGYWVYRKTGTP
ncbi:GlsB/YeaQ/YmgE family stress response membrane protein [Enterovirga rhinocerotis]|uniref:Putative membrane protein YeaQ/YmgE (Transglycosylase-associated protein family) n=1 Tax=Enterovirga rhinocerotis TaxID=1339210 RepID=A0A4R7BLJ9_9HYPH|nr:GlsB/YeaQ/YmgE family stress response membrane protein [Enterovirga rhinocerotis]TDR85522.1 putative membrane protein YeaQ/YmgE (transglycosylase-associated protein family) [Enterovirga rhinocerotis]